MARYIRVSDSGIPSAQERYDEEHVDSLAHQGNRGGVENLLWIPGTILVRESYVATTKIRFIYLAEHLIGTDDSHLMPET